ncbi:MAG TPA: UDP-N-acetylglucosamine 2-epimerase, partial [Bryobacteraceae bacterium]|nr:UDP-N-acetylglucosamine 2-epimerase [Bryobacteraceae bacterium]
TVVHVGCPSSDIARILDRALGPEVVNSSGSGAHIDVNDKFLLVVFHPTTTEYGGEGSQMAALLDSLDKLAMPTLLLWPNIDAGADHISKAIRVFRTERKPNWLRTLTNLSPEDYLRVLGRAACAVGNSSSFVRDAGYFGTPVVLIGNRQEGRETDVHAMRVQPLTETIVSAIRSQLEHGHYAPSQLYGNGYVSEGIANALATLEPYLQKRLDYIHQPLEVMRPVAPVAAQVAAMAAGADNAKAIGRLPVNDAAQAES